MTNLLETLAVLLLSETQDSWDQLIVISLALVALDRRRRNRRNGIRYGRREQYDQARVRGFL